MWTEIIQGIAVAAIVVGAIKIAHNSINNPGYIEWKTTSDAEDKQREDLKKELNTPMKQSHEKGPGDL